MNIFSVPEYGLALVIPEGDPALHWLKENAPGRAHGIGGFTRAVSGFGEGKAGYIRWYGEGTCLARFEPSVSGRGKSFEGKDALVLWADRRPSPFEAVYSEEAAVEEFRKKIGKYLPDDFDYLAHIGFFFCMND